MATQHPIKQLGRRLFGLTKRPLWLGIHALTGARTQATAEYFDFGVYGGYFEADAAAVAERLPAALEVIEARAGVTELEIWCAQYRRVDILQPYNELAVIVPVRLARPSAPTVEGGYVLHMPVTSEEARWSGADNYGFPKILANIAITDEDGRTACVVRHRGVHVLTLSVQSRAVEPFERPSTLLNVRDDEHVIRCEFDIGGTGGVAAAAGGVSLELGHHAIAEDLREVGLRADAGRALYLPQLHARLGRGVDLGLLSMAAAPLRTPAAAPVGAPFPSTEPTVHA